MNMTSRLTYVRSKSNTLMALSILREKKLVSKILAGDKKAVEKFYKKYSQRLLNFIGQKVDDPQDAEEILQDTFISALDSLPLFSYKSSLFTWLCGVTKHEVADFYRKKKIKTVLFSHVPILEELACQAFGPQEQLMEVEIKSKIKGVFQKLSEGYRQILRLRYQEGYSVGQIAKELGESYKAVESKLFRARIAFQKEYVRQNRQIFTPFFAKGKLSFSS